MCLSVYLYTVCIQKAHGNQKRALDPLRLVLQRQFCAIMWVPNIKSSSPEREVSALNS